MMIIDLSFKLQPIKIGNVGENKAQTLRFVIPDKYMDGDIYLDWKLPNNLMTQTEKLENYTFTIPNVFLSKEGLGSCNIVYKAGDVKKVIGKFDVIVDYAINADHSITITYNDVIQDHEARITELEEGSAQGPNLFPSPHNWEQQAGIGDTEILEETYNDGKILKLTSGWVWMAKEAGASLIQGEIYRASVYARRETHDPQSRVQFLLLHEGEELAYTMATEEGLNSITTDWQLFVVEFRWELETGVPSVYVRTNTATVDNPVYFATPNLRRITTVRQAP